MAGRFLFLSLFFLSFAFFWLPKNISGRLFIVILFKHCVILRGLFCSSSYIFPYYFTFEKIILFIFVFIFIYVVGIEEEVRRLQEERELNGDGVALTSTGHFDKDIYGSDDKFSGYVREIPLESEIQDEDDEGLAPNHPFSLAMRR